MKKTIASLEAELAAARTRKDEYYETAREWRAKAEANEKALAESRSHFADLKERLLNAETETARLRGYLSRVHEDDIVRDGLVEIEDEQGKRSVPRRPPPMETAPPYQPTDTMFAGSGGYGERRKRTHWTSY